MLHPQTHQNWHILYNQNQPLATHTLFETIINKRFTTIKVLKDTYNSQVLLFEFQGQRLVVKYPTDRNRRKWIRFTTLFRKGEAKKAFLAFYRLSQLGINVPEPILMAERRRCKMVVDGFLVYRYVAGEKCQEKHNPLLVNFIQTMHSFNLIHGDAHTKNFIIVRNQVFTLDVKAKKTRMKWRKTLDYVQLTYNSQLIETHFGGIEKTLLYRFVKRIDQLNDHLTLAKKRLKQKLGLRK